MEKKNAAKGFLILVAVVILGFSAMKLFGSSSPTGDVVQDTMAVAAEAKEFNVKAFRFGYTPSEIIVNKGDKVKMVIENTDTLHGVRIPELGISGNDIVEFVAEKQGEFTWYCNVMCGSGHMQMKGKLIVR